MEGDIPLYKRAQKAFAASLGPCNVDMLIREAIRFCWLLLPCDKRTPQNVRKEILRLTERALDDMKEDMEAFGPESRK